jgi:cysteine synthase
MRITDIISETTSGAIAGVAMGLGGGDPAASIYAAEPKKKPKKSTMIRRPKMETKNDKNK